MRAWRGAAGAIVLALAALTGCRPPAHSPVPVPSGAIEELAKYIDMQALPLRVTWQTLPLEGAGLAPCPGPWALVAQVDYSGESMRQVRQRLKPSRRVAVPEVMRPQWLPEALRAALDEANPRGLPPGQGGIECFRAEPFARKPLSAGGLVILEGFDSVFVFLTTAPAPASATGPGQRGG